MTDKDIKDYCKCCDVEPPAMRFKCPECEQKQKIIEERKEESVTYKKMLDNPEFRIALIDFKTGECEVWQEQGRKADRYRKALEEIEKILKDEICEECPGKEGCKAGCKEHQCLNIINKAKEKE